MPQVPDQESDVGWSDAGDSSGLPDCRGLDSCEFLGTFKTQALDAGIVKIKGDHQAFELLGSFDFFKLALEVAVVYGLDFDLLADIVAETVIGGLSEDGGRDVEVISYAFEVSQGHIWSLEDVE